ncbi:MAG: hypothetical protein MJB14_18170, partial [Spirochaetes bacterium]|nr:hypothetical protein [Spirochaetota bacterium]
MFYSSKKSINKIDVIVPIGVILITIPIIFFSLKWNNVTSYFTQDFVDGLVLEVLMEDVMEDPYVPGRKVGRQNLRVKILNGEYQGKEFTIMNNITKGHNIYAQKGKKYIFTVRIKENGPFVWRYNYHRANYLYLLLLLFILLVIIIAGIKGLKS